MLLSLNSRPRRGDAGGISSVAKRVDTRDLKSRDFGHAGSIPAACTKPSRSRSALAPRSRRANGQTSQPDQGGVSTPAGIS